MRTEDRIQALFTRAVALRAACYPDRVGLAHTRLSVAVLLLSNGYVGENWYFG